MKQKQTLGYRIEELRAYLNNPLDSSQDVLDLSLRQIIDLEIDHKGYLIDFIEFEKLRAELKGRLDALEIIDKQRGYVYCMVKGKDYLVKKKLLNADLISREELKTALRGSLHSTK